MSITSADGEVHDVSAERRSGWLSVGPDESGQSLTITVDEEGVREWVATRAEQDTVEPKDGIEQIDDEGEVVKVVSEKRDGVEITNADAVADELIDSLKGTSPLEAAFESRTVESTDRKSTRLNSSHVATSYAVFCFQKKTPKGSVLNRH